MLVPVPLDVSQACSARARRAVPINALSLMMWCLCAGVVISVIAPARPAVAQVDVSVSNPAERIVIAADSGRHWSEGAYEVWLLEGHCYINQGLTYARSDQAVLRIEPGGPQGDPPHKIIAFLEGNVAIDSQPPTGEPAKLTAEREVKLKDRTWLGRFYSSRPLKIDVPNPGGEPQPKPAVYQHAQAARDAEISTPVIIPWRRTQFAEPIAPPTSQPNEVPPVGIRRIRVFSRASGVPWQFQSIPKAGTNDQVIVLSSGVNVIIDGLRGFGSIDVQTDRMVIWTSGGNLGVIPQTQPEDTPLELYMEGNIIFRQGERVIEANRMYYNVRTKTGMVLGAEIRSPVPDYEGLLKLKADVVRQLDEHHFVAENVSLTSSRFGVPGYDFRTGVATFEDIQAPLVDPFSQQPLTNPVTGDPVIDHQRMITSQNNFLYVENFPVFYWPFFATDAKPSNYYIERIRFRQDSIFGTQLLTDLNAYQVFGIRNKPAGTKWDISLDEFSERGFAAGTAFSYNRENLLNIPGPYYGLIDIWGLKDDGNDNLGRDRRSLFPESDIRGRIFARHRHFLPDNFQLTAELGLISDRNFLEQWFEHEWDEFKDPTTGLELKQIQDNASWSISADFRPNGAWTDTQWLPRLDHFWLGQPLLGDRLTWYEHSNVAYAQMKLASKPLNPDDFNKFTLLPWESTEVEGIRAATRQELDLPFAAGPVKVVPYALGELAHWGEALNGTDLDRAYGQIGVRASLPIWTAEPGIQSDLFNLNGLAHKVVFDADIAYTDASQNVGDLPLYDPIDDNVIETYRRRFAFDTFGAPGVPAFPEKFDPRFYAIRRNMMGSVTSPSTEIADDLLAARFGIRQRWQTKRGGPNSQRLIDWIQFDTEAVVFPDPTRDNFGTAVGMVNYTFLWNVGERFTVTSDGIFDFFSDGPKYVAIGGFLNRPPRGTWYAGIRTLQGPISATVLSSYYSYRMSDKWISTMGSSFAFGKTGNIGQNFGLTRIGESLLVSLGVNIDSSKGNVGAVFAIEPRFLPRTRLGAVSGVQIPPAGAFGLE